MRISRKFDKLLSNIPGWSTRRRIVVFESDDWGSIRMSSRDAYNRLGACGLPLMVGDSLRYNLYDCLESGKDLEMLFDTLSQFKDINGKSPCFTAVSLTANPDFDGIKKSNFQNYYYEPFTETLLRYNHFDAYKLWQEGINRNLFQPQFHGREHVNVPMWMRLLQQGDKLTHMAFEEGVWGFRHPDKGELNLQASFDLEFENDLEIQKEVITSGLDLFKRIHGYNAQFFVPPNGPFNNLLSFPAFEGGIRYLCAPKIQIEPLGAGRTRKVFNYIGKRQKSGLIITTRNCLFEPSKGNQDWVGLCMSDIGSAFRFNKPAVISTHRVNYIGVHDQKNRLNGNQQLLNLLSALMKKWPDVEFLSANELGGLISKK